jgi:D-3-phosphoglycerate dehydrogenase
LKKRGVEELMIILGSTYRPVMDALTRKLPPGTLLRRFDAGRSLAEQLGDVDVLMVGSHRVTAEVIAAAPRLKLLQQHGRGVDPVDLVAAARAGIPVANVPGGNGVAVAELCLALLLYMAKRMADMPRAIAERQTGAPVGVELAGKTLALVGLGSSGRELAVRAGCLGMKVLAVRARPEAGLMPGVTAVFGPQKLHEVLKQADFVCLLATLTDSTRGLIGAPELSAMKPAAFLINAARGAMVQYEPLLHALKSQQIAGAAFDTFWNEPADPQDPILALPEFFLSPHVAGFSDVSVDHVVEVIAANIDRLGRGAPLVNLVEP